MISHSHAYPLIPVQFILEKSLTEETVQTALPRYVTRLFAHCGTGKSDTSSAELAEPGAWLAWRWVERGVEPPGSSCVMDFQIKVSHCPLSQVVKKNQ